MHCELGDALLKSGDIMKVIVVQAPDAEFKEAVMHFLKHKSGIWQWHMISAFEGKTGSLDSRFYIGSLNKRIISNISIWKHKGAGIVSHVFTSEDHRRKGACKGIFKLLMDNFISQGGKFLTLGTGYDTPVYRIYSSFGFRMAKSSNRDGEVVMQCNLDPDFERDFFSNRPVRCRDLEWKDWPALNVLFAFEEGEYIRSIHHSAFGSANYEPYFLHDLKARSEGHQAKVLESDEESVVGYVTLKPDRRWAGNVWLLDFYVHPDFSSKARLLLESLEWPKEKVSCYVEEASEKIDLLQSFGFSKEAVLTKQIRKGTKDMNVVLMSMF